MTTNGATAITPVPRHRRIGAALAAVALVGALLAGCSASNSSGSAGSAPQQGGLANGGGAVPNAAPQGGAAATPGSSNAERQVVKNGELYLTVDDPVAAADKVAGLADRLGGRVDDREGTGEDAGSASLTIRVPAGSLEDAVSQLGGLGDVTQYTEKTQDVTGTVVDLDARITAAQASVDRVQGFLEHTSTTTELLNTEQALSQRQSDLEALRGQRAALADQVAMSTLFVSLTAPGHPAIQARGPHTFAAGLGVGWHGLLVALRGISVALGVLLPWLVLGAIIAVAIVVPVRARRRRTPPWVFGTDAGTGPTPPAPPHA